MENDMENAFLSLALSIYIEFIRIITRIMLLDSL